MLDELFEEEEVFSEELKIFMPVKKRIEFAERLRPDIQKVLDRLEREGHFGLVCPHHLSNYVNLEYGEDDDEEYL